MSIRRMDGSICKYETLMIAQILSAFEIFKSCSLGEKKQHRIIIIISESQAMAIIADVRKINDLNMFT